MSQLSAGGDETRHASRPWPSVCSAAERGGPGDGKGREGKGVRCEAREVVGFDFRVSSGASERGREGLCARIGV